MSFGKALGYGVVLWLVAFVVASIFVGYSQTCAVTCHVITALVVLILAYLFGRKLNVSSASGMIKYTIVWVIVFLILDVLISTRYTGWAIFKSVWLWVSYLLVLLVSLMAVKKQPTVGP